MRWWLYLGKSRLVTLFVTNFACVMPLTVSAASATWSPATSDYNTDANWSGGSVPGGSVNSTDVATFGASSFKTPVISANALIGTWNTTTSGYNFNVNSSVAVKFYDAGITTASPLTLSMASDSSVEFNNNAACNSVTFSVTGGTLTFNNNATGNSSTIINFNSPSNLNINAPIVVGRIAGGGGASGSVINVNSNFTLGDSTNFTYQGTLSGTGGTITKTDSGTMTLTNTSNNGVNYKISQGGLSIGPGAASGSVHGNIENNANLIFNSNSSYTYSAVISGTGSVTFTGTANKTLTGANSYSGGTSINNGRVSIGNPTALGTGNVTLTGSFAVASTAGAGTVANNFILGSGFNITFAGNNDYTLSGILSGSSTIQKTDGSTLTLLGNNINTGTITISAGAIKGNTNSIVVPVVNNAALIFNQNSDGAYSHNISGSGTFAKTGTGKLILSGTNSIGGGASVSAGILSVTGQLTSAITVAAGAQLQGNGTIIGNVINNGNIAPGTSIGTLNINGNLTLNSAAITQIELDPNSSSKLMVSGTANLNGALSLIFDDGTYVNNNYTILSAAALNGTFANITTSGLPNNLTYSLEYPGNSVLLKILTKANLEQRANTSVGKNIGEFLDVVSANNPTTEQSALISALNSIEDSAQLDTALAQIQPFVASTFLALNVNNKQNTQINTRLACLRNTQYYAAGDAKANYGLWIRPFYVGGRQGNYKNLSGYKDNISGIMFGVDREFNDKITLGLGASYAYSVIKSINYYDTNTNLKSYIGFLYGTYDFAKNIFLDLIVIGGKNAYSGNRSIIVGNVYSVAKSTYDGQQYSIQAILGKKFHRPRSYITPMTSINYTYLKQDAYSETNAGSLGMSVQPYHSSVATIGAGLEIGRMYTKNNVSIVPELHLIGYYDVKAGNINVNSAFITGGPVLNTSAQPGRVTGLLGASAMYKLSNNLELKAAYDFSVKARYFNNLVYANIKYIF